MIRYVSRIVQGNEDAGESAHEVIMDDDAPVKTGLLDAAGVPIYRVKEKLPIGFKCRPR